MKKFILFAASFLWVWLVNYSQDCIPARNINGFGQYLQEGNAFATNNFIKQDYFMGNNSTVLTVRFIKFNVSIL